MDVADANVLQDWYPSIWRPSPEFTVQKMRPTLSAATKTFDVPFIQTLGGFWGVASFAHADIVKLLNEISRRPISRSAHPQDFRNQIQNATKNNIWRGRNFESLVERNAVELGLELKCSKCSSWSWYSLNQLDYQMNCSLCLRRILLSLYRGP